MSLQGKTAVITGSNSGIGLGIAIELATAGADIVLNSFTDTAEDHALAAKLAKDHGVKARYIRGDLSKGAEARALIEQAGVCDILVNNAGIQHVAPIEEFPVGKWDQIIAINLSSAFHTTAIALPMMRKAGWGRVVNIASAHGLTASPFKAAYVSAKHGIVGFTKTAALETAGQNITVQRDLSGLCADAAGRGADPRPDEGPQDGPRDGDPRGAAGTPAVEAVCHGGTDRRDNGVPVF